MVKIEDIKKSINELFENRNKKVTYYFPLETINKRKYAIVLAWQDGFDEEDNEYAESTYRVCGKVAYTTPNSMMHEYDCDWFMPSFDDEVYDTEVSISTPSTINSAITYWMAEFENIKKMEEMNNG